MEIRLLFKHYPQVRWVSSFTVCAFSVTTFLQSSVYNYISKDNKKKQQKNKQTNKQTNKQNKKPKQQQQQQHNKRPVMAVVSLYLAATG